ncbi:MAG: DoxX family protein, partial [Chitinophagales bacterium]
MKKAKIIYLISTGLLSLMMLMSAGMYIVKNADVSVIFSGLGFPTYIIYPLAVAKILGIIAIWTKKSQSLKEW